jgi:hypothetical protein
VRPTGGPHTGRYCKYLQFDSCSLEFGYYGIWIGGYAQSVAGGVSNAGFGSIRSAIENLIGRRSSPSSFGAANVLANLRANWLNGVSRADQKMIPKSLVPLCLTPSNAPSLARATGINSDDLKRATEKIGNATNLAPEDIKVLGRFDAIASAILDEAYESADQQYRNWTKLWAAVVAVVLAAVGGRIIHCNGAHAINVTITSVHWSC